MGACKLLKIYHTHAVNACHYHFVLQHGAHMLCIFVSSLDWRRHSVAFCDDFQCPGGEMDLLDNK